MELILTRSEHGGVAVAVPADELSKRRLEKIGDGEMIRAEYIKPQNLKFHRKLMALFRAAFNLWTPEPTGHGKDHRTARKSFDGFREEVTVLAGYYETEWKIDGTFRLKAKSLKFSKMEAEERERLYSDVLDVVLQTVLSGYTEDQVYEAVQRELAGFM